VTDPYVAKAADHALPAIVASTAAWGVQACHWLPERDGTPALWLTVGTESQRLALEAAAWLPTQVTMMMLRQNMPYHSVQGMRIFVESVERQEQLMASADDGPWS
jgi:hypothetical protein